MTWATGDEYICKIGSNNKDKTGNGDTALFNRYNGSCVCLCVSPQGGVFVCVLWDMEREKKQKQVMRWSVLPGACCGTVAMLVSGKACVSWHKLNHP